MRGVCSVRSRPEGRVQTPQMRRGEYQRAFGLGGKVNWGLNGSGIGSGVRNERLAITAGSITVVQRRKFGILRAGCQGVVASVCFIWTATG